MAVWDPDVAYPEKKFHGFYEGFVLEREDPENLGRVRLTVPGVAEETDWAFPFGVPGGGAAQRGLWWIPELNASVIVCFVNGDPDDPRWSPSNWGEGEAPTGAHPDVTIIETKSSIIEIDERAGDRAIRIRAKDSDDKLEFDLETGIAKIQGASKVIIEGGEVLLGSGTAAQPVPLGDLLNNFLEGILDILLTASPVSVPTSPSPFSSDVAATNSYGAGGIVAVVTAMKAVISQHLSMKVKTE